MTATKPTTKPADDGLPHIHLADKAPTSYHHRMAEWMTLQTGVVIDPKQVQVITALRAAYVATDENQADLAKRRKAAEQRKADALAAKKAAAAKKIADLQAILDA